MTETLVGPGNHLPGDNRYTRLIARGHIGEDKIPIAFQVHHAHMALYHLALAYTVTMMVLVLGRVTHVLRKGQEHRVLRDGGVATATGSKAAQRGHDPLRERRRHARVLVTAIDAAGRQAGQKGATRLIVKKSVLDKDLARAVAGTGVAPPVGKVERERGRGRGW